MKARPSRPRAPNGSAEARLTLRMERALELQMVRAAKVDGCNVNEWVRRAIREKLARVP